MKKFNKRGAIAIQDIVIAVIFVSVVLLAIFAFLRQQTNNLGDTTTEPQISAMFSNTTANLNASVAVADSFKQTIGTSSLISAQGFAALFSGSFAVLRIALNAIELPFNIVADVTNAIGFPWYFSAALDSILIIVIVLIIANIIFGRGRA